MLHDPKWNHGTLEGLITWLEGQDRTATYVFSDLKNCLVCQYMGKQGISDLPRLMERIFSGCDAFKIARGYNEYSSIPQTYGDALDRAYKAKGWPL